VNAWDAIEVPFFVRQKKYIRCYHDSNHYRSLVYLFIYYKKQTLFDL